MRQLKLMTVETAEVAFVDRKSMHRTRTTFDNVELSPKIKIRGF